MFWDLIQQAQIGQARRVSQEAKSTAVDALQENRFLKLRFQSLEETVERVSLAAMAIAEILRDRFAVTQSEVEAKVQEIDLRDGQLDGWLRAPKADCAHCHHTNSARRRKCLYCGEPLPANSGLFACPANEATAHG